ncbi:MAG: DUF6456 domain-containing protein [Pseudomonadota bacterium]
MAAMTTAAAAAAAVKLTGGEHKILRSMSLGAALTRDARGSWRVGSKPCGVGVLDRLKRHDLVEASGDGFRISGPGMAHLQRRAAPDGENRLLANAADEPRVRAAATQGARQVNRAEEPLAWLFARGKISQRQFDAGARLRDDFMLAGQAPRVTMSWDAGPMQKGKRGAPDGLSPTERQVAAKGRLDGALERAGAGLADVLTRIVCLGERLETAERAMGWPARSGKVVLCLGLDRAGDFYRL